MDQQDKKSNKRGTAIAVVAFGMIILFFWILSLSSDSQNGQNSNQSAPGTQQDKGAAQKELTDLMELSKKAGLVSSYELSVDQATVYVGNMWYTQTVQFKKDFLAKIAIIKKAAFGFQHFEIHDAYSNEKVAEVTAFGGSLEVYK